MAKTIEATVFKITPDEAPALIMDALSVGLVPMLTSSPGMGKSSIAKAIAKQQNLKIIDLRLSQCDPTDLGGFPTINKETGKAGYVPMDTFPVRGDKLPRHKDVDGVDLPPSFHVDDKKQLNDLNMYNGWFLLLDEFNSAPIAVQAAAYKIVLDKQVGQFDIHPNVAMMCAGNLNTDRAITNRMSTAMQSRLIHFQMEIDFDGWQTWALRNKLDIRVTSFLNYKQECLHNFNPKHNDKTFPCPRTWEFLSKLITPYPDLPKEKHALVAGTIGDGTAAAFTSFCAIFTELPTIAKIIADPLKTKLSTNPGIRYAICGLIANSFTTQSAVQLMPYVARMPIEFQITCIRNAIKIAGKPMAKIPVIKAWLTLNAAKLV